MFYSQLSTYNVSIRPDMDEFRGKKLEKMLLSYQQLAMNSLRGPAGTWKEPSKPPSSTNGHSFGTLAGNQMSKLLAVPIPRKIGRELPFDYKLQPQANFPIIPPSPSYFLQPDIESETGRLIYCELEDAHIAGFVIGGEERLCLPPILHTILKEIDLAVINEACDSLQIHCSRCTTHQLRVLKHDKILPPHISSAGLIRKTDAERLCTLLLHNHKLAPITNPDLRVYPQLTTTCLPVYHECFGEGHGFLHTEMYNSPYARCISCADCEKLFSPERFVTHTHFNQENKICHWGFNRRNWRHYLLLSEDEICDDDMVRMTEAFEKILDKFRNSNNSRKRKPVVAETNTEGNRHLPPPSSNLATSANNSPSIKRRCNRPPMKAYQYVQGCPAIENPEAIVSSSDKHLYNKHFVPNVCIKAGSPVGTDSPTGTHSPTGTNSAGSSPQEESLALDLSSPTSCERRMPVVSTDPTGGDGSDVPERKETDTADKVQMEEDFVDVESSDGDTEIQPEVTTSANSLSESSVLAQQTSSSTQTAQTDCQVQIKKLQSLFDELLDLTTLSAKEREEKSRTYQQTLSTLI